RVEMLKEIVSEYENIEVSCFDGLLVEYAAKVNAVTIIRGLRALSDFEYELELALMNRHLNREVDTIFMMTDERYSFLRSSLVREVARLGGDISDKVPSVVERYLKRKFNSQ
ncbi:MAG TPA: pantetheine-phosphate adenylyltransferase, partial [Spirochaetota bacterium]|nr:pantetheine-phosphate adenylyltransferase [Spirochaetota bacterium]